MLIEALQNVLANDAGMQSYLGTASSRSDGSNGIFPVMAPDSPTMPYCVLSQVSGEPLEISMQGTGRLTKERWRLSCSGTTYRNAKKFSKYVRSFVVSLLGSQTVGNCVIAAAWLKLESDDLESLGKGTMYTSHIDVEFQYVDNDN